MTMFLSAQTLPDQYVAHFGDNETPYPLYGGSFGINLPFSDADLEVLAKNFDALYGSWHIPYDKAQKVRDMHPGFQFLSYNGYWRVYGSDLVYAERGHKTDVMYYRAGNLKNTLGKKDSVLEIEDLLGGLLSSTSHRDSTFSYRSVDGYKMTFWVMVDNELMKILRTEENKITVLRGIDGTKITSHKGGCPVLIPVFGRAPGSRGMEYRHDERSLLRKNRLQNNLEEAHAEHGGGIWIDILLGNLSHYMINGETVPENRIWNLDTKRAYTKMERARNAEKWMNTLQHEFKKEHGYWPVIWGNNMMFPVDKLHDRLQMLLQDKIKPRPIDGFALENCFAKYGTGGNSGKEFSYQTYDEWKASVNSIIFLGEIKASGRPLMMDGGIDNLKYAMLPRERRYELYRYAYASYLLGVKVEPDNTIYTMMGLCPVVYDEGGNHYFEVAPCFKAQIGKPAEYGPTKNVEDYRIDGTDVYLRMFENGVVLVNPTDNKQKVNLSEIAKLIGKKFKETIFEINPREGKLIFYI